MENNTKKPVSPEEAAAFLRSCSFRNLVFDVDDTLYYRSEPYTKAVLRTFSARMAGEADWPDPVRLFQVSRPIGEEEYMRRMRGEINMEEMLVNRTVRSFASLGISLTPAEALAFEHTYEQAQGEISLLPVFRSLFEDLTKQQNPPGSPRSFLGLFTNGPSEHQRNKIRALGLYEWIPETHIVVTGDADVTKPDTEAFRYYETKCGVKPEETIMIGDSLEADIRGAEKAGWNTLWVRP